MREGLEKEEEIAQVFISEMSKKGCKGVSLEDCGFFVSKSHGFLGASPDKIIHLPTQSDPGVLEMKYIQVKPGQTLKDMLLKQSICREDETVEINVYRADGGCRLVAAALFDLEASVRYNDLQSCTSRQCLWTRRGKGNEGSLLIQDLQTGSGNYGKEVKESVKPNDFNPLCFPYDAIALEERLKAGLLETCPTASVMPYLHSAEEPQQTEEEIRAFINDDLNIKNEEIVESVDVYSMSDYAKFFVAVNIDKMTPVVSKELATEFLESISFDEKQAEMVAAKEYLELVDDEFVLKRETKWNYQIQGLMGISGMLNCDLVIYTHKGILIVHVKFDNELWKEMLKKLRNFFLEHLVQELFHHDIFKSL
ncbi:hypothetical protein ACROYT_G035118 [Oculina patagonica]